MSKIPQEAIEAAELAAFYEWANDQWQNSRPPDNAWLGWKARADAARAQGAEVEPVAIYKGDGLIDCGESGHHNIELLKLIPSNTLLYTAPPAPEVAVKPLVWEVFCGNSGNSKAKAFFGEYVIQSEKVDDLPDWRIYLPNNDHNTGVKYTTIKEAKSAAQADYEQRVRSALTTPPAPQPTDREKVLEDALRRLEEGLSLGRMEFRTKMRCDDFIQRASEARAALAGGEA